METPLVLKTIGLSKSYKVGHIRRRLRPALQGLDLEVRRGEVFGYLGPNGSGKTTTLKLLMGLLRPDSGEVEVLGCPWDDPAWRYRVGYLPEHPYLYDYLTPQEYLDYVGRLFGLPAPARAARGRELLARVGLAHVATVPMRRFSKGMLQRAGIAQALVNDPELLILDEPMSGLDPLGRRLARNLILDQKAAGKTVLFSTHILLDVGPLSQILKLDVSHMEVLVAGLDATRLQEGGVRLRQPLGERWRLEVEERSLGGVVRAVETAGGRILFVQPIRQSLEDYFFEE